MNQEIPPSVRSQAVTDIAQRLLKRLISVGRKTKSIHVLPAESTEWAGWGHIDEFPLMDDIEQNKLNELLGKLAAGYVARELASTLTVNRFTFKNGELLPNKDPFRLGIATGSTVYSLVESFEFPKRVGRETLEIVPLVLGPVPETIYSAGFIADMLAKSLRAQCRPISTIANNKDSVEVRLSDDFRRLRDSDKSNESGKALSNYFNWVLTGIGAIDKGQLKAHVGQFYNGKNPSGLVGDICSRLFGSNGLELNDGRGDAFVGITFAALEQMCETEGRGKRVIAVAGGQEKYSAIRSLLLRKRPGLVQRPCNGRTNRKTITLGHARARNELQEILGRRSEGGAAGLPTVLS